MGHAGEEINRLWSRRDLPLQKQLDYRVCRRINLLSLHPLDKVTFAFSGSTCEDSSVHSRISLKLPCHWLDFIWIFEEGSFPGIGDLQWSFVNFSLHDNHHWPEWVESQGQILWWIRIIESQSKIMSYVSWHSATNYRLQIKLTSILPQQNQKAILKCWHISLSQLLSVPQRHLGFVLLDGEVGAPAQPGPPEPMHFQSTNGMLRISFG